MLKDVSPPIESILGYSLREKIGAGGYGEVWVAEAPGGLLKAVKLVFGCHDEKRAQHELKALNRVKEIRHPFLLSLERIDFVDGRLVVVTELAEMSLKDRFCQCVQEGHAGIPREELLRYMSDAAEALDHLSSQYSLQHLDIKPENLLIVGGHVKVADYGLVKEIHESNQSMMAGLTPTYAPPELFDGQPSRHSDQYSLAIVFQELLTGTRPFAGKTAAQLASQHLQGTPDVSPLPLVDQKAVRRALAKSPAARFGSCRELVAELKRRHAKPSLKRRGTEDTDGEKTPTPNMTMELSSEYLAVVSAKMVETKLPPADLAGQPPSVRPALFLAIGETATETLRRLKYRLTDRLDSEIQTPCIGMLAVDTDRKSLHAATQSADEKSLRTDETLAIPLRTSGEYRERASRHSDWLSRRWIYNVPRSQQTEGLRPLGRLALVDHYESVKQALRASIERISDTDALLKTAQAVGLKPSSLPPKVYLVASISGGVGSGTALDLAYLARSVMADCGFPSGEVQGVLLFAAGGGNRRRDLAVANTFACLSEIAHFSQVADFPGDASCGLPPFEETPVFDSLYLVDVGTDPLPDEYESLEESLAEYLYLNAFTEAGTYFDACRFEDQEKEDTLVCRSAGLSNSCWIGQDLITTPAFVVSNWLLQSWLDDPPENEEEGDDASSLAAAILHRHGVTPEKLIAALENRLAQKTRLKIAPVVAENVKPVIQGFIENAERQGSGTVFQELKARIDDVVQCNALVSTGQFEARLGDGVAVAVAEESQKLARNLVAEIWSLLDCPGRRVARTMEVLRVVCQKLHETLEHFEKLNDGVVVELDRQVRFIDSWSLSQIQKRDWDTHREKLANAAAQYVRCRIADFLFTSTRRYVSSVLSELERVAGSLSGLQLQIKDLAIEFRSQYADQERLAAMGDIGGANLLRTVALRAVAGQASDLASRLDDRLQRQFFIQQGGFGTLFRESPSTWRTAVEEEVKRLSRQIAAEVINTLDLDQLVASREVTQENLREWLQQTVTMAVPHLLGSAGGYSRLLVGVPQECGVERLTEAIQATSADEPYMINLRAPDIFFCYEVSGLPVTQVGAMLLSLCPDAAPLVDRIHTRSDVRWSPLIQPAN